MDAVTLVPSLFHVLWVTQVGIRLSSQCVKIGTRVHWRDLARRRTEESNKLYDKFRKFRPSISIKVMGSRFLKHTRANKGSTPTKGLGRTWRNFSRWVIFLKWTVWLGSCALWQPELKGAIRKWIWIWRLFDRDGILRLDHPNCNSCSSTHQRLVCIIRERIFWLSVANKKLYQNRRWWIIKRIWFDFRYFH